jgi:hypothetical protein
MLEREQEYYEIHKEELRKKYAGKEIVISGESIFGIYDSVATAYEESKKTLPPGSLSSRHRDSACQTSSSWTVRAAPYIRRGGIPERGNKIIVEVRLTVPEMLPDKVPPLFFHPDNPGTFGIVKPPTVKSHVVGPAVDKPFPVPPGPLQSLLPVPLRGAYPVARVLLKVNKLYAVPRPGRYPDTVFVFRP